MRVLLVEDHAELADTVADGLRREGMAVDVALDGHDALARLALTDYDVLVLDRDLPGVHGDQICRSLVAEGRDGRILMLTAAGSIEDRVDGLRLGADDYLPKPFAFAELVARIRALARRSAQPRCRRCSCTATCASTRPTASPAATGSAWRSAPRSSPCSSTCSARRGGRLRRGAARARVGRERRPVHHHRQGDDQAPAHKLGEPPLIETVPRGGYRI